MKKNITITSLFLVSIFLLFYSYSSRSVPSFLWALLLFLSAVAILVSSIRNTIVVIASFVFAIAFAESVLTALPKIIANQDNNLQTQQDRKPVFAYFDSSQTYNTPAYWQLGEFGSQPKPGVFSAKKLASDGVVLYDTAFTIGQDGFRVTPKYDLSKTKRINFLGDSFTFGEGVADNQTMAFYVGEILNSPKSASNELIEVKNFGIHGWGIHQSLAVLQSKLQTKANIQFVLTAPWHASRVSCADFFTLGSPKYKLDQEGFVFRDGYCRSFGWVEHSPKPLRALITSSKLFNLVQDSLLTINDQDQQILLYLGVLKSINKLIADRGERLIVGYIKADERWFTGSYTNQKIIDQIKNDGIELIDMTLAPRNEDLNPKFYIHELDKHPSALGNKARSELLVRYIETQK